MGKCGSIKKCMFGDMCKPPYDIGGCSHYKEKRPQTNEGWLKQCTTEQLAEFIVGQRKGCVYADCPNGETPCMSCKDGCDIDKVIEWLKQPHREESKK